MRILLMSSGGIGGWFLLRLQREGHQCDWCLIEPEEGQDLTLAGLIPPPIANPDFGEYDLILFDSTGNTDLAERALKKAPVIGDSPLASELEDDRLFGIRVMEEAGIEVPAYHEFSSPDEAKTFLAEHPRRFVYKPFVVKGEEQQCATTYVSESAQDLIDCIDQLFADSKGAPFLLQEVVEGAEISTEGFFDGQYFHLLNHTLEEKKFMSGGFGPNTGCAGNLVWTLKSPDRLAEQGIMRLIPFLREQGYRGMIDLNTIVDGNHAYGLEFTPRFGYDAAATLFSLLDGDLGEFLKKIADAPDAGWIDESPVPPLRGRYAASVRLTAPPYPEEDAVFPSGFVIKGVDPDYAWRDCYLWDAMVEDDQLVTVGTNGIIGCPIAAAHTAETAWAGVEKYAKKIKFPNLQRRDDMAESTLGRLKEIEAMGWLA